MVRVASLTNLQNYLYSLFYEKESKYCAILCWPASVYLNLSETAIARLFLQLNYK